MGSAVCVRECATLLGTRKAILAARPRKIPPLIDRSPRGAFPLVSGWATTIGNWVSDIRNAANRWPNQSASELKGTHATIAFNQQDPLRHSTARRTAMNENRILTEPTACLDGPGAGAPRVAAER
jgi:hypothetical protein